MKYAFWTIIDRTRRWLPWALGIAAGSLLAFWLWISFVQPHFSNWFKREPEVVIDTTVVHTNALIDETSPYLQNRAHDLIDWRPWGDDAFRLAAEQDKPVFLMVGYSTSYMCSVMANDSFNDVEIAKVLNSKYIPVMIDREMRPDLDERFMLATQLIRKQSGWPNMVWLTPSGEPWMASSYMSRDQLLTTLNDLAGIWQNERERAVTQAGDVASLMNKVLVSAVSDSQVELAADTMDEVVSRLSGRFDPLRGGFRGSPKFPPHGALQVLMHHYSRSGRSVYMNPIKVTLDGMWLGGIHDHVGGGFHRYATDAQWRMPRFEKTLADNALHMRSYTDGYLMFRSPHYRAAVEEIFDWVKRDMTAPQGAFYTAVDPGMPGQRGAWYLWRTDAINAALGVDDAAVFNRLYHISAAGNLPEGATNGQADLNIPYLAQPVRSSTDAHNRDADAFAADVADMRARLRAYRGDQGRPAIDKKILAEANGLMIGSLAHAGRALEQPQYVEAAGDAADFVTSSMIVDGVLYRSYIDDKASQPGFLPDYAALADGLLTLYEATGDDRWLTHARALADQMLAQFQDSDRGGFYLSSDSHDDWATRSKGLMLRDNTPDPNGIAAIMLMRLGGITGDAKYTQAADRAVLALIHYHLGDKVTNGEHLVLAASMRIDEPSVDTPGTGAGNMPGASDDKLQQRAAEIAGIAPVHSADAMQRVPPIGIELYAQQLTIRPGQTVYVAVAVRTTGAMRMLAENQQAAIEVPGVISVRGRGITVGRVITPPALQSAAPGLNEPVSSYLTPAWFVLPITASEGISPGQNSVAITVRTRMFNERTLMLPQSITAYLPMTVDPSADASDNRHPEIFKVLLQSQE